MASDSNTQTILVPFSSYTPRVAIVTGGTQGIGYSIVHRLADDGIDVAVNDIPANQEKIDKVVEEVRKKGRRAIALPGDVTVEADVIAMIEKTANELGGVDIMVANAGRFQPLTPFLETSLEKFDGVYAINARGVFACFKYAALQMVKQGRGGRLLAMRSGKAACSDAGKRGRANLVDYCAAKFAVRGIVQASFLELRKYGITVNAYAPGPTMTPEIARQASFSSVEECLADPEITSREPFGWSRVEDQANLVSFLVKPESYHINGQTINVNGGVYCD